ncbi:MAG: DUF1700 domain-containing protein [Treponema sp.]
MTRREFMAELAARLHRLPKEDLLAALQYYEEYFDEAGSQNEQEVIRELRSPAHIASKILSDYAVKEAKKARASTKSGWRAFWFTILAICAAPVAVPLIIAAVITILALGFAGFAVFFALIIAAGAIFIKGIGSLFFGSATALLLFDSALMLVGFALLIFYTISALIVGIGKHIKNKANKEINERC